MAGPGGHARWPTCSGPPARSARPRTGRRPAAHAGADPDDEHQDKGASAGGAGQLGAQLDMVANLVELGVPTRAYSVSLGGFDTHSDERGTQQRLLGQLDAALSGFHRRLQGTDRGRQVVVLVYSEFGRRVRANGSDGTDHGTAGPVFLLGRGVRGGFHGAEPSLTDLDDGDLKHTTDFRSVYASVLDRGARRRPGAGAGRLVGAGRRPAGLNRRACGQLADTAARLHSGRTCHELRPNQPMAVASRPLTCPACHLAAAARRVRTLWTTPGPPGHRMPHSCAMTALPVPPPVAAPPPLTAAEYARCPRRRRATSCRRGRSSWPARPYPTTRTASGQLAIQLLRRSRRRSGS